MTKFTVWGYDTHGNTTSETIEADNMYVDEGTLVFTLKPAPEEYDIVTIAAVAKGHWTSAKKAAED